MIAGTDPLRGQLFRYARDLQDLMDQQKLLRDRHQKMLQFMGNGALNERLLLTLLMRATDFQLVTDEKGEILRMSRPLADILCPPGETQGGRKIYGVAAGGQEPMIDAVLAQLSSDHMPFALQSRNLIVQTARQPSVALAFYVLALRSGLADDTDVYWLLSEEPLLSLKDGTALSKMKTDDDKQPALLLTDARGVARQLNRTFTEITGYGAAEVVGNNPRMLSSGLQGEGFYQRFWSELLATGEWSGELFNRRKNGQIYFQWMNIRAVQTAPGKTSCYLDVFVELKEKLDRPHAHDGPLLHDPVTGLANHRMFEKHLKLAIGEVERSNKGLGVFYLGLPRLLSIYEELGRYAGELVVKETAQRIKSAVRPADVVARVSDDEFVVLLPNIESEEALKGISNFVGLALDAPIHVGVTAVELQANMGVLRYPHDREDIELLLSMLHDRPVPLAPAHST
jgi:diguanylate cyclase (GGDEF)-like protein/PAS domain S-box-containing protein